MVERYDAGIFVLTLSRIRNRIPSRRSSVDPSRRAVAMEAALGEGSP